MARLHLGQRRAVGRAGVLLREHLAAFVAASDLDQAVRQLERGLERVSEASAVVCANDETIHTDGNRVVDLLVELWGTGQFDQLAVHKGADEPLLARRLEEILE